MPEDVLLGDDVFDNAEVSEVDGVGLIVLDPVVDGLFVDVSLLLDDPESEPEIVGESEGLAPIERVMVGDNEIDSVALIVIDELTDFVGVGDVVIL